MGQASQSTFDFQGIFRAHYKRVFRIAYRLLRSYEWAEDVTQEVFIKAYGNAGSINMNAPISAWLGRVTTNFCLDELRRRKIVQIEPCTDFDIEEIRKRFRDCQSMSPQDMFDQKESQLVIDKVLRSLPPHYYQALLLKCVDGLSYKDIAYAMDTTVAGVRSIIFRARRQFIRLYIEFTRKEISGINSAD